MKTNLFFKSKRKLHILLGAAIVAFCSVFANPVSSQNIDTEGTEFWLMFNENIDNVDVNLQLFITGKTSTTGTVEIPGLAFTQDFAVTANVVTTVSIPLAAMATGTDAIQDRGIHVTALEEVSVYGLNQKPFTSDAYVGIPTDAIGSDYYIVTYQNQNTSGLSRSQFGVVAGEDNTILTITPKASIGMRMANVPYNITLDAGQTYQARTTGALQDLTGSKVTSNKPVGVFGSHLCATLPLNFGFCDHLTEMMPSTDTWGQNFVTVPFANRLGGDVFRILASQNNTEIIINGVSQGTINSGSFFETTLTTASQITTSQPALVVQFMQGNQVDGTGFPGDPFMMLVAPFEQFLANYTVSTPATGFVDNYVNVVIATPSAGTVVLDGVLIPASDFDPIGSSGFSGAQIEIALGSHNLNSPTPFGVFVYGVNDDDSYGYPGGQLFSEVANVSVLEIAPAAATQTAFIEQCIQATLTDLGGEPVIGVRIDFVAAGVNDVAGFAFTNASGVATFCYTSEVEGVDIVTALQGELTATSTITWTPATFDCEGTPNGTATPGTACTNDAGAAGVYNDNCVCEADAIAGCTDPEALNFNPDATVDDGSCSYSVAEGCYGLELIEYVEGTKKNGSPLDAERTDATQALGEPDRVNAVGGFVSLGYGGSVSLAFDGAVFDADGDDILVWETSYASDDCLSDGIEAAQIELSQDGENWLPAGLLCRDGGVDIAMTGLPWITAIKIINDASSTTFDGYDVDGVEAINGCQPVPNPGEDCFGSEVLSYLPGPQSNGQPITDPNRLDPNQALGAPQLDQTFNFVSLGYGGTLIIGFPGVVDNGAGDDIIVAETTFGDNDFTSYPESADVLVSQDGVNFFLVGSLTTSQVATFDIDAAGQGFEYITMVKVVDTTPEGSASEDGFDVDGVEAINGCRPFTDIPPASCVATQSVMYTEGTRKNGGMLPANRTDETQALGEPEGTDAMVFVTLGYGGSIILGFNGIVANDAGEDFEVVETSFGNQGCAAYKEYADVYVSQNGISYYFAKTVCKSDNLVEIDDAGQGFTYIRFVKIVNNDELTKTPDGFDLDGVRVIHNCEEVADIEVAFNAPVTADEILTGSVLTLTPNPANGPTRVRFMTGSTGYTTLQVFDMRGRPLATLFGGIANEGQVYTFNLDASSYPNGMYVFRLTTENEVATQKLIIAH